MNHYWIVSDGKPGHTNQSLGLVEAMRRLHHGEIHIINLSESWFMQRLSDCTKITKNLPPPTLIIACGHASHLPLLWLGKNHLAPTVLLMKPSLPITCFDLCLIPEHDSPKADHPHIIATRGALNRVVFSTQKNPQGLILIGGPSKNHGWQPAHLNAALDEILSTSDHKWCITDSRRTPAGYLSSLDHPYLQKFPHQQTTGDWLPDQLSHASEVWVTEDSVSMIFEAASSGARVGLLPMPTHSSQGKIQKAVDSLCASGHCMTFADWQKNKTLPVAASPLQEADRCAAIVASRLKLT